MDDTEARVLLCLRPISAVVPPRVVRVDEVNGHRLTYTEVRDFPNAIVWRAIAWQRQYGHWEVAFDDPVLEMNLGFYMQVVSARGSEKVTLHRLGGAQEVVDRYKDGWYQPMQGARSLVAERRLAKIDDPKTYRKRRKVR